MIADYVMKSIDNLFSDKLFTSNHSQLHKPSASTSFPTKSNFSKELIKTTLPQIIRKSISPLNKDKSASFSKSPLKNMLENNRIEKIKQVVKRTSQLRQSSPYQKIATDNHKCKVAREQSIECRDGSNKENDMIKYYREERKSIEKYRGMQRSHKNGKSRIFTKQFVIARDSSTSSFH